MDRLLFGHARRKITPTVPVSLAGYFNRRMWTGVLDDIWAQALCLKTESETAVLVQCDLVTVSEEIMREIRDACADIAGLASENMLFTASHTHTAPEIRSADRGASPEYNAFLVDRIASAVHEAAAHVQPGAVVLGSARNDQFAFNRRYWMKTGEVVTNPPRRDPAIDRPEGPTDPEIGLLGIAADDDLAVLLINIVNHSDTTTGCKVSADWPGALRRRLEQDVPALTAIPVIGTAGNINHFDPAGTEEQSGPETARRIGEGYAASIIPELPNLERSRTGDLAAAFTTFTTGPREVTAEELAEARKNAAQYSFDGSTTLTSEDLATHSPAALKYFADHLLEIAKDRRDRIFELHALRVGDALLLALPGEPFVEIGLQIKREFAQGHPTLIASLNQDAGYIPNRFNFGRGGYETTPRCSPYSMATADRMLDAARDLLADLLRST